MQISESSGQYVKAYPNPAKDLVTFEYNLPLSETGKLQLIITNITGQTIQTIAIRDGNAGTVRWETGDNPSGVYLFKLFNNGIPVDIGKVVITK